MPFTWNDDKHRPSREEIEIIAHRGEELADHITQNRFDPAHISDDIDNRFEEKVVRDITNSVTSCVTTNADLFVGSDTKENREYDILLHVSPTCHIYVEVKSILSSIGVESSINWKRDLIGKPFEYKVMLDNQSTTVRSLTERYQGYYNTIGIVIVDSLDHEGLHNYQKMAHDRGIQILEYDEKGEYLTEIESVCMDLIYNFTKPFDDFRDRRSFF